jgi:2-keto-4-pentenoate hydratase/2-oxohepta-3-ene-1,7-dioic acid hydratase in catechol pathway
MKLIRVGLPGEERPGVLAADGSRIDCSALGEDWDERFFGHGGLPRLAAWLETHGATAPRFDPTERLGSCVARPSKIICIGMNYRLHAKEIGAPEPTEPIIFLKATTALCGPNDDVMIPRGSQKTDWEVELAVVIGSTARYVSEVDAMCHVAGFALHNDYSEREYQMERGGQWVKGKSCDTFAPLGPFMATRDEIADPHALRLWLTVNGETLQDSNTNDLIFNIPTIVSYLAVHDAAAGRRHLDRHTRRRRPRLQAAALPQAGRRGRTWHRRPRDFESARRGLPRDAERLMLRIDAHQHFWQYDPVRDAWINDGMAVLRQDFLPADLGPLLAANGIDGCVAVQADQSERETRFLLDLARDYPFIRGVVGWVDLRSPHVGDRLAHFAPTGNFVACATWSGRTG